MSPPARSLRSSLLLLLALDVALLVAVARLPSRLQLPPLAAAVPAEPPSFAAVLPDRVSFVLTARDGGGESSLVTVPLAPDARPPASARLGADLAVLESVRGMDAVLPAGARWAWSGRTLLLAAPSRRLGADRFTLALAGPRGLVARPTEREGTRPSAGWARDHFEVAYVTPAPPPNAGRVQWVVDVSEQGAVSNERIAQPSGVAHTPFAWPGGVRTEIAGAEPGQVLLPDGTVVPTPREEGARFRPFFVLGSDGGAQARFARFELLSGSALAGDYRTRTTVGDVSVEAHLGTRVARPRYVVSRGGTRRAFEAEAELRARDLVVFERAGVLHLVDPRGFHARLRASDLAPLDPTVSRVAALAGALGTTSFLLVVGALLLAHALALLVERGARGKLSPALARFAGLSALLLAVCALVIVWSVG